MPKPAELKMEKHNQGISQARALTQKAEDEKRDMTAEEREQFDKLWTGAEEAKADADRFDALEKREAWMSESAGRATQTERADGPGDDAKKPEARTFDLGDNAYGESRTIPLGGETATADYQKAWRRYILTGRESPVLMAAEERALKADEDEPGGYLQAPLQFQAELIKAKDNLVWFRSIARVLPPITKADGLGSPSLDADPADPTWVNELDIGSEDTTMDFGKRELHPHPMAQFIKVSNKLLRVAVMSPEAIVKDRLAYKNSVVEENIFLNGDGASQPLGVFTASDDGIGTGQDVSTGNTTTSISTDGLYECVYSLPAQYRTGPGISWIFHRDGVKQIAKLKDGEGRYLWQPAITAGLQPMLLNYGVRESEYAPSTFETGLYVGILGDFSYYWIVDALTMTIQVLKELYAGANQTGYISRSETDGMPVLAAAFARVTLG